MEINIDDYNIDAIKRNLEDYYGTAKEFFSFLEASLVNLDNMSDAEIIIEALKVGIDIDDYLKGKTR